MDRTEHGHAGHGAGDQADDHGRQRQQRLPAAQRQQQHQHDAGNRNAADPAAFGHGLGAPGRSVQRAAGHQQVGAGGGQRLTVLRDLCGDARGGIAVEGVFARGGAYQHPGAAGMLGQQRAGGHVVLHRAARAQRLFAQPGQAEQVLVDRHGAGRRKGVDQFARAALGKGRSVFEQLAALRGGQQGQAVGQQDRAQLGQVDVDVDQRGFEQAALLPAMRQQSRRGSAVAARGGRHQRHQLAAERFLDAGLGQLAGGVGLRLRHQFHQVGGHGPAVAALPCAQAQQQQQPQLEQPRQPAFKGRRHVAPRASARRPPRRRSSAARCGRLALHAVRCGRPACRR
ncbi:hypothetical protein LMG3412_06293 [Achromobacter deleyi]|nr:hypothetical protein LMG3412_06293 [Achromobacter deleyi]